MNEHMIPLVMFIAANAILWTWQFIVYKLEERGKHENKHGNQFVKTFTNRI